MFYETEKNHSQIRRERLIAARLKGTHTKEDWNGMKAFFDNTCVRCHIMGPVVKDHIIPIYQGGSDSIKNLQPLCSKCNSAKGPENVDHRVLFCQTYNIEFPTKWKQ
jgi:5-methylcytosine-specific restriction endonuclease McrA